MQSLPYPVLVVHGTADERIPADHGARVFDAAPAGSDLWLVAGAGHVDSFTAAPEEYHRRVVAYFESRLAWPLRAILGALGGAKLGQRALTPQRPGADVVLGRRRGLHFAVVQVGDAAAGTGDR